MVSLNIVQTNHVIVYIFKEHFFHKMAVDGNVNFAIAEKPL